MDNEFIEMMTVAVVFQLLSHHCALTSKSPPAKYFRITCLKLKIVYLSHHSRRTNNGGHYLEEATINQVP